MRKNAIKLVVLACTLALGAALAACTPQESATQANQAAGGVAEEQVDATAEAVVEASAS